MVDPLEEHHVGRPVSALREQLGQVPQDWGRDQEAGGTDLEGLPLRRREEPDADPAPAVGPADEEALDDRHRAAIVGQLRGKHRDEADEDPLLHGGKDVEQAGGLVVPVSLELGPRVGHALYRGFPGVLLDQGGELRGVDHRGDGDLGDVHHGAVFWLRL
jgi:hypothetical protein